jgi:hypothetical protein
VIKINISKFINKLDKLENNFYMIEEEVTLIGGKYEGELEHDNIDIKSVNVYSGSKLTGEKIDNYILSTPSKTPWRKHIKVYSNKDKLYISYFTPGDTVEASDINNIQDVLIETQKEINKYEEYNNSINETNKNKISDLNTKCSSLDNNKADKIFVSTELNNRYTKDLVFTKDEVLRKIEAVIGTAPEALDTLKEIADSLNNDSDFAGTMTKQLSSKVDKVTGKQLSDESYTLNEKNKLAGIESNANKYIHPSTHLATMITEDVTHRFVTDAEKSAWNDKANTSVATTSANGLMSSSDKSKLDGVAAGANAYTHPNTHAATMITEDATHRFVTDVEKIKWNSKLDGEHNHDGLYMKKGSVTWNDLKGV